MKDFLNISIVKRISAIALLATIALSHPVWLSSSNLKPVPVFLWCSVPPVWNWLLSSFIVLWAGSIAIYPKGTRQGLLLFLLLAVAVVIDMNRCQIWLLHFVYIFLLPESIDENETKIAILFLLGVTYVFSGVHKFNMTFAQETVPWLIRPFRLPNFPQLALIIPATEIVLGVFILAPKVGMWFNVLCVLMHTGIIFLLVSYRWDLCVIPWNLLLVVFHVLTAVTGGVRLTASCARVLPAMGLFIMVAVLGSIGFIHQSFSFRLYSGNQFSGIVVFSEASFQRLPDRQKVMCEKLKSTGEHFLNLDRYAMDEIGVPLFQHMECYKAAASTFIPHTKNEDDLVLLIRNGSEFVFDKDLWAFTLPELKQNDIP